MSDFEDEEERYLKMLEGGGEGPDLSGADEEERKRRQAVMKQRSGDALKEKWQAEDRKALDQAVAQVAPPVISEGKCHTCFEPESLVRTFSGYKEIQDVQVGELVLSGDGNWNKVKAVMMRPYEGVLYGIQTHGSLRPIWMTPDHPITVVVGQHFRKDWQRTCQPYRCKDIPHETQWTPVSDVTLDHYVGMNGTKDVGIDLNIVSVPEEFRGTRRKVTPQMGSGYRPNGPVDFELSNELLWAIGLYLAEGSSAHREIVFSLHRKEVEYQGRLRKLFESYGYKTRLESRGGNGVHVHIYSSTLCKWWPIWLGRGCENKRIPEELMMLPTQRLKYLIQGINDGDGKCAIDEIEQTSLHLALQLIEFGLRVGRPVSASSIQRSGKRCIYRTRGCFNERASSDNKQHTWMVANHLCSRVKSLDSKPYSGIVWNLEVDSNPTYTVEGLLVHNCQSPHRLWIERQLVKGTAYKAIAESIPDGPSRRSISDHFKSHMALDQAAVRALLNEEADLLGQNYEEGVKGAFTLRGALDVLIRKAYQDAIDNVTTVEPKDLIQMIKLYNDMNTDTASTATEEAKMAINLFKTAIQNVLIKGDIIERELGWELITAISDEVGNIRAEQEIDQNFERVLLPSPGE